MGRGDRGDGAKKGCASFGDCASWLQRTDGRRSGMERSIAEIRMVSNFAFIVQVLREVE